MNIENNFYSTQGWMIQLAEQNKSLDKATLPIFAIVYGFSQTAGQWYTAPISYIVKMTISSRSSVIRGLNKLVEGELLIKKSYILDGQQFAKYKYNKKLVDKLLNEMRNQQKTPSIDKEAEEIEAKIENENSFFDGVLENFCLEYKKISEIKFGYKINNFDLESWKKSLNSLIESQSLEMVQDHLEWYFRSMKLNKYIPIAKTIPEFCFKFSKIVDSKIKNKDIADYFPKESFAEKFAKAKKNNPNLTEEYFTRQQFYKGIREDETPSQYITRKKREEQAEAKEKTGV